MIQSRIPTRLAYAVLLLLGCLPLSSAGGRRGAAVFREGAVWDETEYNGRISGRWTRRATSEVFDASWGPVTAVLAIHVDGDSVSVARRQSSDGNDCDYQGTLAPDGAAVSGTYRCTKVKGPFAWTARIGRREPEPRGLLTGDWEVSQIDDHGGQNHGVLHFKEEGGRLAGNADWAAYLPGPIAGTVSGEALNFNIAYQNGEVGYYKGKMRSGGRITGTCNNKRGDYPCTWQASKKAGQEPPPRALLPGGQNRAIADADLEKCIEDTLNANLAPGAPRADCHEKDTAKSCISGYEDTAQYCRKKLGIEVR